MWNLQGKVNYYTKINYIKFLKIPFTIHFSKIYFVQHLWRSGESQKTRLPLVIPFNWSVPATASVSTAWPVPTSRPTPFPEKIIFFLNKQKGLRNRIHIVEKWHWNIWNLLGRKKKCTINTIITNMISVSPQNQLFRIILNQKNSTGGLSIFIIRSSSISDSVCTFSTFPHSYGQYSPLLIANRKYDIIKYISSTPDSPISTSASSPSISRSRWSISRSTSRSSPSFQFLLHFHNLFINLD